MAGVKFDNFIQIPFRHTNLDRYVARTSILKALTSSLPVMKGRLLDAGCGKMPYREYIKTNSTITQYIGLDIESALIYDKDIKPDFTWDGEVMPFADEEFDTVMATEVLEHCPDPGKFLSEVNRVLKVGGTLFFTVPFLWNLHEVPHDEFRYTPFSLNRLLLENNFKDIAVKASGGWHASLAQAIGLWCRRGIRSRIMKKLASLYFMPFVWFLVRMDTPPKQFIEGVMSPGFYGTATKK